MPGIREDPGHFCFCHSEPAAFFAGKESALGWTTADSSRDKPALRNDKYFRLLAPAAPSPPELFGLPADWLLPAGTGCARLSYLPQSSSVRETRGGLRQSSPLPGTRCRQRNGR